MLRAGTDTERATSPTRLPGSVGAPVHWEEQDETPNLATFSNLNAASGYQQHSFSLGNLAGQTVTLKFTGTEDSSLQTSFVVDDTAVNTS
jgi:hypothetical protein